jgi:small subunit ribosomal protein S22
MKVASEPTLKKHHGEQVNVEELFIDERVQELLKFLTGIDLEGKIFRERKINRQERSHYALMTNEMFDETLRKMAQHGKKFLQFVPVKEPRPETATVLSKDEDIADFDDSKFVFTDITFDATDQDRTVVVREVDGTLRTALPEEHDRMNRIYYNQPNRPVYMPPVFSDPDLQNALDRDKHEFVLDWACYYFEPDDSTFVKLCTTVFDRTIGTNKISLLHSTRHFGAFVFYAIINGKTPPLLNFFGQKGRYTVRIYKAFARKYFPALPMPPTS